MRRLTYSFNCRRLSTIIPHHDFCWPLGSDVDFTVVVAVSLVRVMQMAIHQIVDVIAVRNSFVTTVRVMNVVSRMRSAIMLGGALLRIAPAHRKFVIIDVITMEMMHVAVVQVVSMPIVVRDLRA
jgi:hypothetical protein